MDVTFHEDIPYYSLEGKGATHEEKQGELLPLVQIAPPLSYQDPASKGRKWVRHDQTQQSKCHGPA